MTPLPKKKHTRSRSNKRRNASYKIVLPNLVRCAGCKKLKPSHQICPHCGSYGKADHAK